MLDCADSRFWIGLGIGVVAGAFAMAVTFFRMIRSCVNHTWPATGRFGLPVEEESK